MQIDGLSITGIPAAPGLTDRQKTMHMSPSCKLHGWTQNGGGLGTS